MRRFVAAALVALSAVCAVVDTVVTSAHLGLLSERAWTSHGWPLITLTTLGCAVMGGLIVARHPRHPVGWLLLVGSTTSVGLPAEVYSLWVLEGDGPGPDLAGHLAAWLSAVVSAPLGLAALVVVFLIAPDGHLRSPRWRWVVVTATTGLALSFTAVALLPPTRFDVRDAYGPVSGSLAAAGILLILGSLIASVVCLLLRLRQLHGEPRRQLLWLAASAAVVASALVLTAVAEASGAHAGAARAILFASYLTMPVAIAVAVLRHRLLDIEVIVNRTLFVTLATALVAVAYVGLVVTVGPLVSADDRVLPSLLATAAVALAFQPLRRRVVWLANRLAYGAAAVPYDAMADLSRRLRDSPDPASLLPALGDAARRAVGARRVTVLLAIPSGPDQTATWPTGVVSRTGGTVDVPIADAGERLGVLSVEMPPGRAVRVHELELLRGLAQAAVVPFRGARLSAELAAQVDALDRATHDLEASRRRLITAADAERSRLQDELAREVVPHLTALPGRLEQLAAEPVVPSVLDPLIAQAVTSLEALREITRGVYPAQLARAGLEPALRSLVARTPGARLSMGRKDGERWARDVEAAAYFFVAEAVGALATPLEVALSGTASELVVVVEAQAAGSVVLVGSRDRVEAVGGTLQERRSAGRVTLQARLTAAQPTAWVQAAASRTGPSSDLVT